MGNGNTFESKDSIYKSGESKSQIKTFPGKTVFLCHQSKKHLNQIQYIHKNTHINIINTIRVCTNI